MNKQKSMNIDELMKAVKNTAKNLIQKSKSKSQKKGKSANKILRFTKSKGRQTGFLIGGAGDVDGDDEIKAEGEVKKKDKKEPFVSIRVKLEKEDVEEIEKILGPRKIGDIINEKGNAERIQLLKLKIFTNINEKLNNIVGKAYKQNMQALTVDDEALVLKFADLILQLRTKLKNPADKPDDFSPSITNSYDYDLFSDNILYGEANIDQELNVLNIFKIFHNLYTIGKDDNRSTDRLSLSEKKKRGLIEVMSGGGMRPELDENGKNKVGADGEYIMWDDPGYNGEGAQEISEDEEKNDEGEELRPVMNIGVWETKENTFVDEFKKSKTVVEKKDLLRKRQEALKIIISATVNKFKYAFPTLKSNKEGTNPESVEIDVTGLERNKREDTGPKRDLSAELYTKEEIKNYFVEKNITEDPDLLEALSGNFFSLIKIGNLDKVTEAKWDATDGNVLKLFYYDPTNFSFSTNKGLSSIINDIKIGQNNKAKGEFIVLINSIKDNIALIITNVESKVIRSAQDLYIEIERLGLTKLVTDAVTKYKTLVTKSNMVWPAKILELELRQKMKGETVYHEEGAVSSSLGYSAGTGNGGAPTKYKSTGQAVYILYKKKNYKRTIYVKEKTKTKYCKINNEYILLSKLKIIGQ